jgi:hypothetical protein
MLTQDVQESIERFRAVVAEKRGIQGRWHKRVDGKDSEVRP